MYSGVRLSQLAVGEPLLNANWEYKELKGKAAVEKRFEDVIYNASYLGFTYIIDTVRPQVNASGELTLENNGVGGNVWTFEERMEKYKEMCASTGLKLVLEFDFPTTITLDNAYNYKKFFLTELIAKYEWVKYWQIGIKPEDKDGSGIYSCSPDAYVDLMRYIYTKTKNFNSTINIGGPGCLNAIGTYISSHSGWLAEAFGEYYGKSSKYDSIGPKGFLPYIDFFAFQGMQNTTDISYSNYGNVIDVLKEGIYTRIGNNSIYFISTKQGWKTDSADETSFKQQGYYDVREMLNAIKYGVIPFKNELVDEYPDSAAYNGKFDASRLNYGIFTWYLGQKDEYTDYSFILQQLSNYSEVYTKQTQVYEDNSDIDSITFRRVEEGSVYKATVLWNKSYGETSVILLTTNYQREYQTENGSRKSLTEATEIQLKNTHFVIVFETINQLEIDTDYLTKMITRKLQYQKDTQDNLISLLPSSYNAETTDTNFYKLLRAVSVEMSDAKITLDRMKDDLSIDLAREEALYDNFGVLVKLRKKASWTCDKYRRLVKGVTKSLLDGPTYQSVIDALQLFTNFSVHISELYKDSGNYDDTVLQGINTQYAFIVEIEKPLEDTDTTQDELKSDTNFVLNIVKPAHTLSILIITLSGSENWQKEYADKHGYAWKDMDSQDGSFELIMNNMEKESTFGWRGSEYDGVFKTSISSNTSLTNGGNLIGPRYVLYDKVAAAAELKEKDDFKTAEKLQDTVIALLDFNLTDRMKTPVTTVDANIISSELTFGYDPDDLLQLTGGSDKTRILNKFRLSPKKKLHDDSSEELELYLREQYVFSNTMKTIRFSNRFGFNSKFYKDTDRPYAISQYLFEHTFNEIQHRLADGTIKTEDRIKEDIADVAEDFFDKIDMQKIKESQSFDLNAMFNDKFYNDDDVYSSFTLNITPINRHKIGPNLSALYSSSLYLKDIYDKAKEYLENIFSIGFKGKYDKAKEKRVDYNPIVYDETNVLKDEKIYGIRLNSVFLNNTTRKFIHKNTEYFNSIASATRLEKYKVKKIEHNALLTKSHSAKYVPKSDKFLSRTNESKAKFIINNHNPIFRLNNAKLNTSSFSIGADKDEIKSASLEKYLRPIAESRTINSDWDINYKYTVKEDKLISDFTMNEESENFKPVNNFFKLNQAKLGHNSFSITSDTTKNINPELFDKYLLPIKDKHTIESDWVIDYHYKVKEDKLISDFTMNEESDTYSLTNSCFKLNHAKLGLNPFSFNSDSDKYINSELTDKYLLPIKDESAANNDWVIDYHYKVKEDKVIANLDMTGQSDKYSLCNSIPFKLNQIPLNHAKLSIQADATHDVRQFIKDKYNLPIDEKRLMNYEQTFACDYKPKDDKANGHYLMNSLDKYSICNSNQFKLNTARLNQMKLSIHADANNEIQQLVYDEYAFEIDEKRLMNYEQTLSCDYKPKGDKSANDYLMNEESEIYTVHNDACFRLNRSRLNVSIISFRGDIIPNFHQFENETYEFEVKEYPEIFIRRTERYDKNHIELADVMKYGHESRILQPTIYTAFRFTAGRFNKNRLLRIDLVEDNRWNCISNDVYKFDIKEYHKYNVDYVESVYKPKNDKHIIYGQHSNKDTYSYTINENETFLNDVYEQENYELKSVVGYMQLDRYKNGSVITLKKGTLV